MTPNTLAHELAPKHIASCCRILGVLFYHPPNHPNAVPAIRYCQNRELAATWPLGGREDLRQIEHAMSKALAGDATRQALIEEYQRLFVGPNPLEAPPWGSVHLEEEQTLFGETTEALRNLLATHGVGLQSEYPEPEDHIGLLLWAAAWLADRGQEAALDALLETHILTWSDTYLDQLGRAARHPFYQCLAALTRITLHDMQERRCPPDHP